MSEQLSKLIKDLKNATDPEIRWMAAEKLGELKDRRAVEALIDALEDDWYWVRNAAAWALGELKDERAIDALIKAVNDKNPWVKISAVASLGKIASDKAVDALIKALEDKDQEVSEASAEVLVKTGNKNVVSVLIKAFDEGNKSVKRLIIKILGKIGDARAVDTLIKALEDSDVVIKRSATEALVKIGDERAVDALIKALEDNDVVVKRNAAVALAKIGSSKAVRALLDSLKNRDIEFQAIAETLFEKDDSTIVEVLLWVLKEKKNLRFRRRAEDALKNIEIEKVVDSLLNMPLQEDLFSSLKDIPKGKSIIESLYLNSKQYNKNYPHLFCRECYLRAQKKKVKVGLLKSYEFAVCRGCGKVGSLEKGVKKVVGVIGDGEEYKREGDVVYVKLWDGDSGKNADIDVLEIRSGLSTEDEYDMAINSIVSLLKSDVSRDWKYLKQVEVVIKGAPPLSNNAKRILKEEFKAVKKV